MELLEQFGPIGGIAVGLVAVILYALNFLTSMIKKSNVKKVAFEAKKSIKDEINKSEKIADKIAGRVETSKNESAKIEDKIESRLSEATIINNTIVNLDNSIASKIEESGFKKKD